MRLVLAGCEYSGASTLAVEICRWGQEAMGGGFDLFLLHDHYTFPHTSGHGHEMTEDEQSQMLALSPQIKEMVQRHNAYYHVKERNYNRLDHIVVGLHIEDSVYGPLYFGYGGKGEPGDRGLVSPDIENMILRYGPDTVLVLVKASPGVIAERMKEHPHKNGVLQERDIEHVLRRFEEEYAVSRLLNKLTIDTTTTTVGESVREFVQKVEPFLTETDRLRLLVQKARRRGDWV